MTVGNFTELTIKLNQFNKLFLDRLEHDLKKNNIHDINRTQALIVKTINDKTINVKDLYRGGYNTGTNIFYNLNSLVGKGYVLRLQDKYDGRAYSIKLTEKGKKALCVIDNTLLLQEETLTKESISNITTIVDKLLNAIDHK